MSESIVFEVPGLPVAQPRQRHRVVTAAGRTFAQNYTPKGDKVNVFKASVQHAARAAYQGPLLEGPLTALLVLCFDRPQYLRKKSSAPGRIPFARKPDWDNCGKSIL